MFYIRVFAYSVANDAEEVNSFVLSLSILNKTVHK